MSDRDESAPALLSFLIGGIVGASLTCLLAPQSGVVLRRRIRKGVDDGRAAARRLAEAGRAFASEASEVLIAEGVGSGAAASEPERAPTRRARKVPEPGLPTDMGGGGGG